MSSLAYCFSDRSSPSYVHPSMEIDAVVVERRDREWRMCMHVPCFSSVVLLTRIYIYLDLSSPHLILARRLELGTVWQ
jgi:hypothetical protein